MAIYTADSAVITIGGNQINQITNIQYSDAADQESIRFIGDATDTNFNTSRSVTGTLEAAYDPDDASGQDLLVPNFSGELIIYPNGNTTGERSITFTALFNSLDLNIEGGTVQRATYAFGSTGGSVVYGTVA